MRVGACCRVALGVTLACGAASAARAAEPGAPTRVVIDTDPGIDDTMAVLLALRSPAIEVVAITTVFGNVTTEQATRNALTLVELAGASVPVARGAERPLVRERRDPPAFVHGRVSPAPTPTTRRGLSSRCEIPRRRDHLGERG